MNNKKILESITKKEKKNISIYLKQTSIDRLNEFKEHQVSLGIKKPKNSEIFEELLIQFLDSVDKFKDK